MKMMLLVEKWVIISTINNIFVIKYKPHKKIFDVKDFNHDQNGIAGENIVLK